MWNVCDRPSERKYVEIFQYAQSCLKGKAELDSLTLFLVVETETR